jgi:CRP-like cAMP-binding protein
LIPTPSDLKTIALLSGLNKETLDELVKTGSLCVFAEGAIILMQGDLAEAAYFILEGQVRIFRTGLDGRDQIIAMQRNGEAFNTVPPLLADPRIHSNAQALTQVRIFKIPSKFYLSLLQRFPDFTFALLANFDGRLA